MNTDKQHFFANEITLHFNLRSPKTDKPTPIYAVVRIKSTQIKIPTNVRVYPSHWVKKKEQALVSSILGNSENKNNRIANQKIMSLKLVFAEFLEYIINEEVDEDCLLSILYEKFKIRSDMKKKRNALLDLGNIIDSRSIKDGSKRQYKATLKSFEDFIKEKKGKSILAWDEFTLSLITDYRDWYSNQVEVHNITKERVRIEDNTVISRMTSIYTILKWAQERELIDLRETKIEKIKEYKTKRSKSEDNQIYLTEDEINHLFSMRLEGAEEQVRDLFIFQNEVGQRYSDINGLKVEVGDKIIHIIQEKTGKRIDIILTDTAYRILSKYNFELPSIDNAKANKLIKEIAKKGKINRKIKRCERRGGTFYPYTVEAWQIIGTHTARRSFVSNGLQKGLTGGILKKQTGHSTDSSFSRYNRTDSLEASNIIAQTLNGKQTPSTQSYPSNSQDLREEIRKSLKLENEIQQKENSIKSIQSVVTIEQTIAEDEKMKRLTIEEAYRKGIPYELFLQIQREQDEIADNCL